MYTYLKPILGLSDIRSATFLQLVHDYEKALVKSGYNPYVVRLHLHSVSHFVIWLERKGIKLETIEQRTVAAFNRHRPHCRCRGTSRNRGRHVVSCVRIFLHYLREQGKVPLAELPAGSNLLVDEFLQWMTADRGAVETTLASYQLFVTNLVEFLGDDPRTYTARGLRDFIAKRYRHYGHNSIRMVLAAVRMFLRYLTVDGRCRPGLDHALPSPAIWSQQSLPQGLAIEEVQRTLTSCSSAPAGIRDRAVLLLLIRLGLRASDVAALQFKDLCFETATIKVSGKGRREVQLPLPQEVGDALLEYLRGGRPQINSNYVFLRAVAPFRPFGGLRPGHAVSHIARTALRRAGVQCSRRGAHVFRHTTACWMLSAGVGLA
jgi:integrase/recombinase XerD